ncbi:MAG: TonB-dependent receptor [Cyclobacteriaceae bacterium]
MALSLIHIFGFAQTIVQGTVTSEDAPDGLPGVAVLVQGTSDGTITDIDGNYKISVEDPNATLEYSFIGYKKTTVNLGGRTTVDVGLEVDIQALEEVVVIGYGTQKKKEVTGAVVRVEAETLQRNATSDLGSALQGQIAGVNVTASSGAPGSGANILIRGLSTISGGSNAPLYVVDGVPYASDPKLSMNEIESVDVLKDAASASIYGTRGSAGVILITTKQAKAGVLKIGVDSYYGIQKITSGVPLMNFEDDLYASFLSKGSVNGSNFGNSWTPFESNRYSFTNNTDLNKVLENDNAAIQQHGLTISGGKENIRYNLVGSYFSQDGSIINSSYSRLNLRANTGYKKGNWDVQTGMGFRIEEQEYEPWQFLLESYKYHPWQGAVDPDAPTIADGGAKGSNEAVNLGNLATKLKQSDKRDGRHLNGFIQVNYELFKGFTIGSRIGGSFTDNTRVRVNPLFKAYDFEGELIPLRQRDGTNNRSDEASSFTWENSLRYERKFGDHEIKLLGVFSTEEYKFSSFEAQGFGIQNNSVTVLGALTSPDATVGSGNQWSQDRRNALVGMLGRVQYNYKSKYLVSLSARRDGSTRFSEKFRWGTFPSVMAGWNVDRESFWSPLSSVVNAFKVRASYGTTGNQNILDYSNAAVIEIGRDYVFGSEDDDRLVLGAIQRNFANKNVKWETTIQQNLGFDIALFNNKWTITADFYNTDKKDMLFPVVLPTSVTGLNDGKVTLNVGNMNNKGFELASNFRHIGKVSWSIGGTFSRNINKVTKTSGSNDIFYLDRSTVVDGVNNEDRVSAIAKGYEAGAFFLIETDGLITTQEELEEYQNLVPTAKIGDLKYVDAINVDTNGDGIPDQGDGTINLEDRVYSGSAQSDFDLGLNFSVDYKGFDFSMQWYATVGGKIMNGSKAYAYKFGTHQDLIYQWSPANPTSDIPANRGTTHENYRGHTDYWLENGSFARLRNVAFGYTIPKNVLGSTGINKLRVYISAQNPITITNYDGFDPEVGNDGLNTRGLDKGTYPISSTYRAGIQFDF